ncbi:hypothetical protein T492DRAFT_1067942 [Pavlovales sp. CCMP2436]|nr:hypothetical protein T492DRAFT_1067942 [Pavlovales sp. CCMP2436]
MFSAAVACKRASAADGLVAAAEVAGCAVEAELAADALAELGTAVAQLGAGAHTELRRARLDGQTAAAALTEARRQSHFDFVGLSVPRPSGGRGGASGPTGARTAAAHARLRGALVAQEATALVGGLTCWRLGAVAAAADGRGIALAYTTAALSASVTATALADAAARAASARIAEDGEAAAVALAAARGLAEAAEAAAAAAGVAADEAVARAAHAEARAAMAEGEASEAKAQAAARVGDGAAAETLAVAAAAEANERADESEARARRAEALVAAVGAEVRTANARADTRVAAAVSKAEVERGAAELSLHALLDAATAEAAAWRVRATTRTVAAAAAIPGDFPSGFAAAITDLASELRDSRRSPRARSSFGSLASSPRHSGAGASPPQARSRSPHEAVPYWPSSARASPVSEGARPFATRARAFRQNRTSTDAVEAAIARAWSAGAVGPWDTGTRRDDGLAPGNLV